MCAAEADNKLALLFALEKCVQEATFTNKTKNKKKALGEFPRFDGNEENEYSTSIFSQD
jgi:hypothetical protein